MAIRWRQVRLFSPTTTCHNPMRKFLGLRTRSLGDFGATARFPNGLTSHLTRWMGIFCIQSYGAVDDLPMTIPAFITSARVILHFTYSGRYFQRAIVTLSRMDSLIYIATVTERKAPNKLAGVGAGRKPEFIEMMQVGHSYWSGSAGLGHFET